jgi:hypothetical protein
VGRYPKQTGSLAGITPEDMRELVSEVTFNALSQPSRTK